MRVKWSQNFLIDKNIAKKIVGSLLLEPKDVVLEIGSGKGVLTELLLRQSGKVFAVEIDPELCDFLEMRFRANKNLKVFQKDFLEFPLKELSKFSSKKVKVIGNLPYAVTSPILQRVLSWNGWSMAVFMMQKEVAERILSRPGSKDYGVLSVSVQVRSEVRPLGGVSRNCFRPVPHVDSALLRFIPKPNPFKSAREEKRFFETVKAGFAHRRKTVLNSLLYSLKLPGEKIKEAIEIAGLSPNARAETFSIDDFKKLSFLLWK